MARDIFKCRACGVGVTLPMPSRPEIERLYATGRYRSDTGKRFVAPVERLIRLARHARKNAIRKHVRAGRVLEIGCGRGDFLDILRRDGWEVRGTELNAETAGYASRAYGIPVDTGNPGTWGFGEGSFDLVVMNHVLEHVPDPAGTVRECRRLLREGGLLVVAVPDICSLQARAGGRKWFHLDATHHVHHFSGKGLIGLLERFSFRVVRIKRFDLEYNLFGWLQTLLNLSGVKKDFLYDLLKRPDSRDRRSAGFGRDLVLTSAFLPFCIPLSVVLSLVESYVLKAGGTVEAYAVRR